MASWLLINDRVHPLAGSRRARRCAAPQCNAASPPRALPPFAPRSSGGTHGRHQQTGSSSSGGTGAAAAAAAAATRGRRALGNSPPPPALPSAGLAAALPPLTPELLHSAGLHVLACAAGAFLLAALPAAFAAARAAQRAESILRVRRRSRGGEAGAEPTPFAGVPAPGSTATPAYWLWQGARPWIAHQPRPVTPAPLAPPPSAAARGAGARRRGGTGAACAGLGPRGRRGAARWAAGRRGRRPVALAGSAARARLLSRPGVAHSASARALAA
jgi:hypothetical protein